MTDLRTPRGPPPLSARVVGSFAYLTIRDRLPTILTKAVDSIHRNKDNFLAQYGEEGVRAEKAAIALLSKLRNELQTDKPVLPLSDELEDADAWNRYLQRQGDLGDRADPGDPGDPEDRQAVSWFQSPWLYVECYMYRRIQEALWMNPPISDFDVFSEAKTQSYFESQRAVIALCTYMEGLRKNIQGLPDDQLLEHFGKLLQVSLWGNKCDLSISAGQENSQKVSPLDSLADLRPYILVDDSRSAWSALISGRNRRGPGRVDIILDNAGFELTTDLVLADFLVTSGLAHTIRFHGKSMPWFVSDVTAKDFHWTIQQTMASNHMWMSKSGAQWRGYVQEGTWTYNDHPFWTQPHQFRDMAADAADLYAGLQGADLVLFKGDLNYRKLTGDLDWEPTVRFGAALQGFGPAPLCSLRTLKANVQVGLQPGQAEKLSALHPDWMTSGKYAVIQFHSPHSDL